MLKPAMQDNSQPINVMKLFRPAQLFHPGKKTAQIFKLPLFISSIRAAFLLLALFIMLGTGAGFGLSTKLVTVFTLPKGKPKEEY